MPADINTTIGTIVRIVQIDIDAQGNATIMGKFLDFADGVSDRGSFAISAPQTGPMVDQLGRTVAAATPNPFKTAATAMVTNVQTALTNAITAGKIVWPPR